MTKITKPFNQVQVTGTLVEHSLTLRHSERTNRDFINGKVVIDTAAEGEAPNEVVVNVMQMADKKDKKNEGKMIPDDRYDTYVQMMDMIGQKVGLSCQFDNSVFVDAEDQLVKGSQVSSGFPNVKDVRGVNKATFKVTLIIKDIKEETDREENPTGNLIVRGNVLNYNASNMIPRSFTVSKDKKAAVDYFLSGKLETGDVTDLWGVVDTETTTRVVKSAFGEDLVEEGPTRVRMLLTGARPEPYEMDEDLEAQIKTIKASYETYVATQEKQSREYRANKDANSGAGTKAAQDSKPKTGGFNF